jgi:ribose-phosphate pyrophosphokinase
MITFKAKTRSGEIIKSAISDFIFPAGEAHLKVEPKRELEPTEIAIIQPSADSLHDDLFKLAMWNNYLTGRGIRMVLIIPYFPGARADRVSPGVEEPFGLSVYAEFIGNMVLDQIILFDPHSEGVVNELKLSDQGLKITVVKSAELFELPHVKDAMVGLWDGIIAPDKGALTRASEVAEVLGVPVYTAEKTRDPQTGKLNGFKIEDLPESSPHSAETFKCFLIVDDICDRGGTFLGLVKAIGRPYGNIGLFVSHGVFSSDALDTLPTEFEDIYTTNSYNPKRDLNENYPFGTYERFDIIHLMLEKVI